MAHHVDGQKCHCRHHHVANCFQARLHCLINGVAQPSMQRRSGFGVPVKFRPPLQRIHAANKLPLASRVTPEKFHSEIVVNMYNTMSHLKEIEPFPRHQEKASLPVHLVSTSFSNPIWDYIALLHCQRSWGSSRSSHTVSGDGHPLHVQISFFHFLNKEYQQCNQYQRVVVDGRNLAPAHSFLFLSQ